MTYKLPEHAYCRLFLTLFRVTVLGLFVLSPLAARDFTLPDDPRQSITYWAEHTLALDSDPNIQLAHEIFTVLLRAWDHSRLSPGLFVVRSESGPWAASLADGNILLSHAAIALCMQYGKERGEHLLAFVLAHELAHQRADDLWHQRFFRLLGDKNQSMDLKHQLQIDKHELEQIQQKEAQADHDGLLLMASVGFNPLHVIEKTDFFTDWVEHIWKSSCQPNSIELAQACKQARQRSLRSRLQLETLAAQSSLYEMGIQAFVAGDYTRARHYLTVFGRDYRSRAVLSSLAMSYLAEAQQLLDSLIQQGHLDSPRLYYPLILDAQPFSFTEGAIVKRGQQTGIKRLKQLTQQAIKLLEQAIKLDPEYRQSTLLLAIAHLMNQNTYMARGIIQGQYIPAFSADHSSELLLAMTLSIEKQNQAASQKFDQLIQALSDSSDNSALPYSLLLYTTFHNSVAHGRDESQWKQLAKLASSQGDSLLFQLALQQFRPSSNAQKARSYSLLTDQQQPIRPGDRLTPKNALSSYDFWAQGEKLTLHQLTTGSYIVLKQHAVLSSWQEQQGVLGSDPILLRIGEKADRPFKTLGLPDRQYHLLSGEYLAYDRYGLAIRINRNRVAGWFHYQVH